MAVKFSLLFIYTLLVTSSLVFGQNAPAQAPESDDGGEIFLGLESDPDFVFLNTKDPKIVALAKDAFDEHNKETKSNLVYESLLEATSPKDAQGKTYDLVILASRDKNEDDTYSVKIEVDKNNVVKVLSFTQNP